MSNIVNKKYAVFISSTFEDLKEEREEIVKVILGSGDIPIGMESFPAGPDDTFEYIKQQIDNCDYYLLIIAGKYGSIHKPTGFSFTEVEYDYAIQMGIPIIPIIKRDLEDLPRAKVEITKAKRRKLEEFRRKASSRSIVGWWNNPAELQVKAALAIQDVKQNTPRPGYIRSLPEEGSPQVKRFGTHGEQANFFTSRLDKAFSIQDLTWAKSRTKMESVHEEIEDTRISYVEDIARFSADRPYIELFIFDDNYGVRQDRLEKLRYHYQRCKDGKGGRYSCGYFKNADFPRLQYTLIDVNEILFTSGSVERMVVNQPELASIFKKYFEHAWEDAHKLIEDGDLSDEDRILQILAGDF